MYEHGASLQRKILRLKKSIGAVVNMGGNSNATKKTYQEDAFEKQARISQARKFLNVTKTKVAQISNPKLPHPLLLYPEAEFLSHKVEMTVLFDEILRIYTIRSTNLAISSRFLKDEQITIAQTLEFRVQGSQLIVQGLGVKVQCLEFSVQSSVILTCTVKRIFKFEWFKSFNHYKGPKYVASIHLLDNVTIKLVNNKLVYSIDDLVLDIFEP